MNDLILLESVSARNEKLTALTQDAALDHLNKAKALVMAVWQGTGVATTEQMADYYDVSVDTVKMALLRHQSEFDEEWFIAAMSLKDKLFDSRKGRGFLAETTKESRLMYLQNTKWTELAESPKKAFVYFILDTGNKLIKIGFSKSVEVRMANLQMGNINVLRLLAVCEGGRSEEHQLHKKFAEYRVRSEWFKDCKEIRDFIGTLSLSECESQSHPTGVWTPRSALRLGMLLRDSAIAKQVRTLLLDLAELVPKQNDRLRELELANENMRLMLEWSTRQDNRIALHGLPIALMLEGKTDAVVEIEKPTIEVFDDRDGHQVKYVGQTCAQLKDYMKSRYGITFKSGEDVKRVLEKIEAQTGESLLGSAPRKVITSYVPLECSDKAIAHLRDVKNWQMLLGQSA